MSPRDDRRQQRMQLARERRAAARRKPTWIERAASWRYEHFWTYTALLIGMVVVAFTGRAVLR